ncbi:hypothetical protein [Polluticoccus soli]|uniref:hypothetical protein n=1 Tax=Polluticoccus soli TaxID=3034150 RepID=UPI0023E0B86C|nr:hypothetical protein [Flavipsychrobacter sp. JY13-12]
MQHVELYYLIDKQLDELIDKASRIIAGSPSDDEIVDFYRHSAGVKRFLSHHVNHTGVQKFLKQVPELEYKGAGVFDSILSLPFLSSLRINTRISRREALEGIKEAHNVYATIFYLHQAEAV